MTTASNRVDRSNVAASSVVLLSAGYCRRLAPAEKLLTAGGSGSGRHGKRSPSVHLNARWQRRRLTPGAPPPCLAWPRREAPVALQLWHFRVCNALRALGDA